MAYFDWNPAHDTGIASIDFEHHRLVQALNGIHDFIARGAAPASISDALAEFHTTAAAHFALEERTLEDERHPDLGTRRRTHYQLLDEVRDSWRRTRGLLSTWPGSRLPTRRAIASYVRPDKG